MNSWTRTLNMDDAHTLLALAEPGVSLEEWTQQCYDALPELSIARRRELVRLLRDGFLTWKDDALDHGLFLRMYREAPAVAQLDLVHTRWALTHPITLATVDALVAPAHADSRDEIALDEVDSLVADKVDSASKESLRKTRTVLLAALDAVGALQTRGTGQHRTLKPSRGTPHPLTFCYGILLELAQRGADGMMYSEAVESSLTARLSQCGHDHAELCVRWGHEAEWIEVLGDEVRAR